MKVSMKKTVIVTLASLAFLGAGVLAFTPILKLPVSSPRAWMGQIEDSTPISNISLPGSHDTMARTALAGLSGECQYLDLESQLNSGVRFLDIRLDNKEKDLRAVHGSIDQGSNFSSIERIIERFLKNNPSEGLLVSIKDENRNNPSAFESTLSPYLSKEYWLLDTSLPSTLKDIRGKAVLLSRYENSSIGVPCYNGWADGGDENKKCEFALPNGINVQDHYKLLSAEDKLEEISSAILTANASDNLTLNFCSGYLASHFPPSNAQSVAVKVNPKLPSLLTKEDSGVIIMDFVTEDLCKKVFSLNKGVTL
ncbi:MAG: phosphatidylinositol-specific phospholipase C domain-containing protein [Bacilli bacterium]|nr:phosphatidylinositol-specific phospholipase C domain-containing protein [Bacilli bacterium]